MASRSRWSLRSRQSRRCQQRHHLDRHPDGDNPEGGTLSYTYQWLQNGVAIGGATAATLDLSTVTVAANDVLVEVTPSDGTITGTEFTSGGVKVASIAPTVIALPTVTSVRVAIDNPNAANTLTATPQGTDPEGGTVTFTYQWLKNGTPITARPGRRSTWSTIPVVAGDVFTVKVTPTDGTLTGASITSDALTVTSVGPIVIAVPTVTSVTSPRTTRTRQPH